MDKIFGWLFEKKIRFFLLLLGVSFFLRSSSLYHPFLDVDESQFAGFAHALMDGGLPYRDSLDTKPPLIYLFYALQFFLFGKYNMLGPHLVLIFWTIAICMVLYKISRENGSEKSGYFAALFYTIFSTTHFPKFIAVSITSVLVLPITLAVYFWLKGEREESLKNDFWAGIFASLAFLLKYQAGIQVAVFLLAVTSFRKTDRMELKIAFYRYAVMCCGFLVPVATTLGTLYGIGVWDDFVQWSVKGSFHYIQAGGETIPFFKNLVLRGGFFVLATFLLWLLAGRVLAAREFLKTSYGRFLAVWLVLSFVPVAVGGRFYGHYFIQLLPPLCLLAGMGADRFFTQKNLKIAGMFLLIPAFVFWILRTDQKTLYELFPDDQLFEQQEIGKWLKENTKPDDTLFVWGFATAIYFHAQRRPASRFLWTDLLTGKVPGSEKSNDPAFDTSRYTVPEAWDALWEDFNNHPPKYFVDTSPANIHNYKKYPVTDYPMLFRFIQERYTFWKNIGGCPIYKLLLSPKFSKPFFK